MRSMAARSLDRILHGFVQARRLRFAVFGWLALSAAPALAQPVLTIDSVSEPENQTCAFGINTFTFSVTATPRPVAGQPASFTIAVAATGANPATFGQDLFDPGTLSGTITDATDQTNVSVFALCDGDIEPDETFSLTLTSATNATIGVPGVGIGTIINDDDASPSITATTPANGTVAASNANLVLTFSEAVTLDPDPADVFTISCSASGTVGGTLSGTGTVHTINPGDFAPGESCTATILAAGVFDTDTIDPPNSMSGNVQFTFSIDTPPAQTTTQPANGAVDVAPFANFVVNFSEAVNFGVSSFVLLCEGTPQPFAVSGSGSSTATLDPLADLPPAAFCSLSSVAGNITDVDSIDPPNAMSAGASITFTTFGSAAPTRIHSIQGTDATVTGPGPFLVEGVVVGDYQGATELGGFFLQEENADVDALSTTSEGIFVACGACPDAVAEGNVVRVLGSASDVAGMSRLTLSGPGNTQVVDAGNRLSLAPPSTIALPIAGDVDAFYEAREGMRVHFGNDLFVADLGRQARFGDLVLHAVERPLHFTQSALPGVAGYAAHLANLATTRVVLDDRNDVDFFYLTQPGGQQPIFHPAPFGLSALNVAGNGSGVQGEDFFRAGDRIFDLTGVLHWSGAGAGGTEAWRIRPTAATPAQFVATNLRPDPPTVDGQVRVASINLQRYFTTTDVGFNFCGPGSNQGCPGADSAAELARQRARTALVLCTLDADIVTLLEIQNGGGNATQDIVNATNALCPGNPYQVVFDGGVGGEVTRVGQIFRPSRVARVGAAQFDGNAIHNRPPMAQAYTVVAGPASGETFTVVVSHFTIRACSGAAGADLDQLDGQACYNARRIAQAQRLLSWLGTTVLPVSGDPDVLLVGNYGAHAKEDPLRALLDANYFDLLDTFDPDGYSYSADGQLGRLDHALASATLATKIRQARNWPINADENALFDYNDANRDPAALGGFVESPSEVKPNGSGLSPPRNMWDADLVGRAGEHDPVLVGVFGANPTITTVGDASIAEDTTQGFSFSANDAESSAANLTVTAVSSNQAVVADAGLALNGSGNDFTLLVSPVANATGSTTITLAVRDEDGQTGSEAFVVTVTPVNDDPTIGDVADASTASDTPIGPIAFLIGDIETPADDLVVTAASDTPSVVANAGIVLGGSGASRTVTITPAGAAGSATITLSVTDADAGSASDTFELTVTAANTAPTISAIADATTDEDLATGSIAFAVGDAETAAQDLLVGAASSNPAVAIVANVALSGSGSNRFVQVTPEPDASGTTTITLTVTDGGGAAASESFVLTVDPVNDDPTIVGPLDQTIGLDGTTGALALTIGDVESSANDLVVTGASSDPVLVPLANITIDGAGSSRTVTVTPAPGRSGSATLTLTVQDVDGGTGQDSFVLTVNGLDIFDDGFEGP